MNDETGSDYLSRPEAQGHLKVMELLREWDPIGVLNDPRGPSDEYDMYSAAIVEMLDTGIGEDALFSHLKRIVVEHMEIRCDEAKTRRIARELKVFWDEWNPEH